MHGRIYKGLLGFTLAVNSFLCLLFTAILIYAYVQKKDFPTSVAISFITFIALFVCFLAIFIIYLLKKTDRLIMMAVALAVARFLAVLICSFVFMSEDTYPTEDAPFSKDIMAWIQSRKLIVIGFALLYVPFFLLELFVLNRYYSSQVVEDRPMQHVYEKVERSSDARFSP